MESDKSLRIRKGIQRRDSITSARGITRAHRDGSPVLTLRMLEPIQAIHRVGMVTHMPGINQQSSLIPMARRSKYAITKADAQKSQTRKQTNIPSTKITPRPTASALMEPIFTTATVTRLEAGCEPVLMTWTLWVTR